MNSKNKKLTLFAFAALLVTTNAFTMYKYKPNFVEQTEKQKIERSLKLFLLKHSKFRLLTRVHLYRDGEKDRCPQYYRPIINREQTIKEQGTSVLAQYRNLLNEFLKTEHDQFRWSKETTELWHKYINSNTQTTAKNYDELKDAYLKTLSSTPCFYSLFCIIGPNACHVSPEPTPEHNAYDLFTNFHDKAGEARRKSMSERKQRRINELKDILSKLRNRLEKLEHLEPIDRIETESRLDLDFPGYKDFEFVPGINPFCHKKYRENTLKECIKTRLAKTIK